MHMKDLTISKTGDGDICQRKMASHRLVFLVGILLGITLFHVIFHLLLNFSYHLVSNNYRWYNKPQRCSKSHEELEEMRKLALRTTRALEKLRVPSAVCYGTLWGVIKVQDVLPWDSNVDFCVMNERLENVTFLDLQTAFGHEGVVIHHFSYWRGSYRLESGGAEGLINVFIDCTDFVYMTHSEFENKYPDYLPGPEPERPRWACPYSLASAVGKLSHDINRPFPAWLLTPPFQRKKLGDINVKVPHDSIEMQKYIYPDDWWLQKKPIGCS